MALTSDRIIDLARDKIIGRTNFTSWKKDKNRKTFSAAEILSILGLRLCIDDVACNKRITSTTLTISNQYSLLITLGDFFKTLLVAEAYKELTPYLEDEKDSTYIQSTLCNALIRFTHFIKVTYTPSRQELLQFFIHDAAVLCKECEKATSALLPAHIGIEDLPHIPFLSIYMQLRSQSKRFEILSSPTLCIRREAAQFKRTISEVSDKYLTQDDFLKKARLMPLGEPAGTSEISAFRNYFQVASSLFGLSPNVYACLTPELTHALEKLLVTSMDILDKFVDEDDKRRIIKMLPLQYR
ncbi:8217_t:CDS:2 [Funneliformis caledonium]|uniref:8217_t:CDS:1 n=1 Tax=Funneliformis caledonium TaxID=1117310 RepID=A0A9N8VCR6_9GLOM|nr:8217_t:CDS:2 [Funneliformis caledonium]